MNTPTATSDIQRILDHVGSMSGEELGTYYLAILAEMKHRNAGPQYNPSKTESNVRRTIPPPPPAASASSFMSSTITASVEDVERQIFDREGFKVEFGGDRKERLPTYSFNRGMKDGYRVGDWRRMRFEKLYKGHTVRILLGDGDEAKSSDKLPAVRATYR